MTLIIRSFVATRAWRQVFFACVLVSSVASIAAAQDRTGGLLVAVQSGACLGGANRPAAVACDRAPRISLVPLPGRSDRVLIRDDGRSACLFANRDGRFGWFRCTPEYEDQHWWFTGANPSRGPVAAEAATGRMLRAVHTGQCLFSNADGRFGFYACTPGYGDQFWQLGGLAPLPAPPLPLEVPAPLPAPPLPLEVPVPILGDWAWSTLAH